MRKRELKNVEWGFFLKIYYKSENIKLFNNINATVNVLIQLGYDAEIEEIGDNVTKYENASFSEINELHDLCRILSMNYSILFGNTYNNIIDISIGSTTFGKNVSDRLLANDIIYCNANGEIIGIKRDGIIMKLKVPSPCIIAREDYSGDTKVVSFEKVKPTSIDLFETQSDTWHADNKGFTFPAETLLSHTSQTALCLFLWQAFL